MTINVTLSKIFLQLIRQPADALMRYFLSLTLVSLALTAPACADQINGAPTFDAFERLLHGTPPAAISSSSAAFWTSVSDGFRIGHPQTYNFGQLGQITSPYPGVLVNRDALRVLIGADTDAELGTIPSGGPAGAVGSSQAIVGIVNTPAGDIPNTAYRVWPDAGLAGYGFTAGGPYGKAAVGLYGMGAVTSSNGGVADGANLVTINCRGQNSACTTNGGFDFQVLSGSETNSVIVSKADGTAPGGAVLGHISTLNAEVQNTGALFGFDVQAMTAVKWKIGYQTENGSAEVGIRLGATAKTGTSLNSQQLQFLGYDAKGNFKLASIQGDSLGDLAFYPAGGNYINVMSSYPQLTTGGDVVAVGSKIVTSATTGATVTAIFETGTLNSNANIQLSDAMALNIKTGAAVTKGIILAPAAGPVTISADLTLSGLPKSGTSAGTLCVAPGGAVFIKTTPGACL